MKTVYLVTVYYHVDFVIKRIAKHKVRKNYGSEYVLDSGRHVFVHECFDTLEDAKVECEAQAKALIEELNDRIIKLQAAPEVVEI